jgi:polar amino acid transport system substrate-binding protein
MSTRSLRCIAFLLGFATMIAGPVRSEDLKGEIAPTGKLRVAIAISTAGGAFWSNKTESGYAGVPVYLGKAMADELGVPVEYIAYQNSGQITDAVPEGAWDVAFLPKDAVRETKMSFGPIYDLADSTYIVKPGSTITNYRELDQPGVKVAVEYNTTTMRGVRAHLKNATIIEYQTFEEVFDKLKEGEVDAFALSREQLNNMSRKIPGTRVLDETFRKVVTAVAVRPDHPQALAFVTKFMTDARTNGILRKAYDTNGLPIRAQ